MLQTIAERFPDVKVSYIGMDIDKKFCEQARELLGSVKNTEVEIIVEDYQEIDPSKFNIPPCDLVLAVHVFYYMRDITKALVDAQKFRKQDGMCPHVCMVIMLQTPVPHSYWLYSICIKLILVVYCACGMWHRENPV